MSNALAYWFLKSIKKRWLPPACWSGTVPTFLAVQLSAVLRRYSLSSWESRKCRRFWTRWKSNSPSLVKEVVRRSSVFTR